MTHCRVKLGEVAQLNPRLDLSKLPSSGSVGFIAMADVGENGELLRVQRRCMSEVAKGYTSFRNGDVLLAKITPCFENGKAALVEGLFSEVGFGSTEFHVLRPSEKIDAQFLFYLVWNSGLRAIGRSRMTGSGGQKRLPVGFLKSLEFDLPLLNEQKRIARIIEKAEGVRRKRDEVNRLADAFLKATFIKMFGDPVTNPKGWSIRKFGDLGQWASGGTPDRTRSDFFQGSIPWFSAGELNAMYVSESSERITDLALTKSSAKLFVEGSLLLGMYDTAAFKASILQVRASSNQACANFRPGPAVIVEWFYYFIQLSKEHFLLRRRGVRQKNLNLGMIQAFDVPLPPVGLQEEFVRIVRQVRKIHADGSAAGALCKDLAESLRNTFLGAQSEVG